ncbi:thymidine phosphorylase [Fulvimarina endophytica]|uniref:Thymidine phosphorylase n=1 Tax=Fulvimarina endophytica TaxID=2293836 RepID=A0A371X218_9HYPH|nr:thymidine phosphorylase [Fulvimarina endophytica]RFC63084.1 thymidine phosphorylase [Fulvimarina endophytica]
MTSSVLPQETIRRIRDGEPVSQNEIAGFANGLASGAIGDAQAGAFAMAVFLRGLETSSTVALTEAMRDSGTVLRWPNDGRPVLDKHSTGGIGDAVSLVLAPILAACGARVPMISGRGLGHTGGTLDKLDAIPGYRSAPDLDHLKRVVDETGLAIVAATADLAPADRRLYAIRDVTATVDSLPLITASILSKKLAAGTDALILDVKLGSGAFMTTRQAATELAEALVSVANGAGLRAAALLSDMNEPLAPAAGNAVEVQAAIDVLTGEDAAPRLRTLTLGLAAALLQLAQIVPDRETGLLQAERALVSGAAAERFARMVHALGGPADSLERAGRYLPQARIRRPVFAARDGTVSAIDGRAIGLVVIGLGGGRRQPQDAIDHAVGFTHLRGIGETVDENAPIGIVHARTEADAEAAARALQAAYRIGARVERGPLVLGRLDPLGHWSD